MFAPQGKSRPYAVSGAMAGIVALTAVVCLTLTTPRSGPLLVNTCLMALGTCSLALPLGILLAVVLARTDVRGRGIADVALAALLFFPLYLQVAGWEAGFGRQGWYSLVVRGSLSAPPLDGWRGAIWVHAVAALPWVVWIVRLGLSLVPPEFEEQALLHGRASQVLRRVTLPYIAPFIVAAGLWVLIVVMVEITVTDVYQIRTFAEELYLGFAQGQELQEVQLRVLPASLIVGALVLVGLSLCQLLVPVSQRVAVRPRYRWTLVGSRKAVGLLLSLCVLVLLAVPIANLLYHAGILVQQNDDGQRVRNWSLAKCLRILWESPWRYRDEFKWSLILGQLSAVAATAVSIPLAYWSRGRYWKNVPGFALCGLGLAVPGPVIGLLLIALLNRPELAWCAWLYDKTIVAPWAALSLRCFPLAYMIIWQGVRSVPEQTLEAASLDGTTRWNRFLHIAFPQFSGAVLCAWLVSLAVALGDLSASILVMPPGVTTVAYRIFDLVHYGVEDQLAGLCLTTVALFTALAMLARLAFLAVYRERAGGRAW